MDNLLHQRLKILEDAKKTDKDITEAIVDFVNLFENKYNIIITEDNGSMLVTHLAMALARIRNGQEINKVDEEVFKEIKQNRFYKDFPEFYELLERKLDIKLPSSEKEYIALHGCALIENFCK